MGVSPGFLLWWVREGRYESGDRVKKALEIDLEFNKEVKLEGDKTK